MDPVRHFRFSLFSLVVVIGAGTLGYHLIEGWALFDSLYMTVITLATVGYKEVQPLSVAGKGFTIVLIICGTGIIAYAIGSLVQLMVEGQLRRVLGRKKLEKQINKLSDHYIVCGYGRIGTLICREFLHRPVPFVVVEKDPEHWERLASEGHLFVRGDATDDDTLEEAGIRRARGLITAVTSDTANVYITLTARGLNPDLFILARAGETGSEIKLKRAGANKVVSPYSIGATRMAQAILRPSVVDFIELATGTKNLELQLDEIVVSASSRYVGQSLITSGIRKEWGIIIVGVRKQDGQMAFNPDPSLLLEAGDTLVTLGKPAATRKVEEIAYAG